MQWSQNYTPTGDLLLSCAFAALPVIVLLCLLAIWHVRAQWAAIVALGCACAVAFFVYGMPATLIGASALYGMAFGLFPIGWIVLNAIFIYEVSVTTGQFEVLKRHVAGIAADRRIQALLIAFSFGAFIEGCAGFGAPVAITGALLIGLGFKPLEAAKLALIGNTAPVAFGSLGIPLITLNKVTDLDLQLLSTMVGRQLPVFSLIVPFWLVVAQAGWRGMRQVWPACLVTGLSFAIVQFLVSNYHGPWLVDLASALVSIVALVALLRVWNPEPEENADVATPVAEVDRVDHRTALWAWMPWICLSVFVAAWTLPVVKGSLNALSSPKIGVPLLQGAVMRMPPAVAQPEPEKAEYLLNWLSATGTALLVAGIVAGLLLGANPVQLARLYLRTIWRVRVSLLTIAVMLALGFVTKFSGCDTTMGLAFTVTGWWFPFFSPLLGWLGVALTGSDTSSNVLFGNLQKITAEQLGLPPILTAAANSSGGVMGKMIDAQSIVVASVATGGREHGVPAGAILRAVFWHSLALGILMGVWVLMQAYLFPGIIPR